MDAVGRFLRRETGMSTVEYIVGVAVVLGTLVIGVNSWNVGLVNKLQSLVLQLQSVR
jgi:Flp pilus assembly pilin Flp